MNIRFLAQSEYFNGIHFKDDIILDKEYEDSFNTLDIIPIEDNDDKERELEKLNKTDELLSETFQYITDKYTIQQFELFRMYMFLKPHISYKKLSDITNLSIKFISQTISAIKKDIQENQELITKRKKLIYN